MPTTKTIVDIVDIWEELDSPPMIKSPSPEVTFADDPIALSWASYAIWKKYPNRRWVNLNDVEAHPHDREIAAVTRKYYRDRFTMNALKGKQLTEFQQTLYGIVLGEQPILKDQIGIIMKIPYFYVEDTTLDNIFANTKSVGLEPLYIAETREDEITPCAYTFATRRRFESHQYWFVDSQGRTTMWTAASNNPLVSVVRSLHERKQPLKIRANWHYAKSRGPHSKHVYWNLNQVELL